MLFAKDNSEAVFEQRVVDALYIYFSFYIDKDRWLNDEEIKTFAVIAINHFEGNDIFRYGAIKDIDLSILSNSDYRYVYLDSIKKKQWIKKKGKKALIPETIIAIISAIKEGEQVIFQLIA